MHDANADLSGPVFTEQMLLQADLSKIHDHQFARFALLYGWEPTRWWEWRKRRRMRKLNEVVNTTYLAAMEAEERLQKSRSEHVRTR